jgi:cell fate regulator YaaT (PSP1 superfamily)
MRVVKVQFTPWDNKSYYFSYKDIDLVEGDKVIVKTELGVDMGEVLGFVDLSDALSKENKGNDERNGSNIDDKNKPAVEENNKKILYLDGREIKPILRKATVVDEDKLATEEDKKRAMEYCRQAKEKYDLPIKLIDVHFSFDGSRIIFAFIADGRVDFRELVKDLTRHFGRTIRLQQIGIRDEARIMGDYGHCGQRLCCQTHLKELTSITSEMAELQECSHRGSERISGVCGRLMCCLAYEQQGYEELSKRLPPVGAEIKVGFKKGKVVKQHVLKQTVEVEIPGENGEESTIVEMEVKR